MNEWKQWKKKASQTAVILLSSVEKRLHPNLINCSKAAEIWDKLEVLYGDSGVDAKQSAWEQFYVFTMSEGQPIEAQIEILEGICKKLEDAEEKPTDQAVISKIISSLPPKFSLFRLAWECTPEADRKKTNLIARLIKEDKRKSDEEETTTALAAQVQKTVISGPKKKFNKKKKIEELKKRTKCVFCNEKGHWVRECPKKRESENNGGTETASAYVSDVTAFYSKTSDEDANVWIADSGASMHMTFREDYFVSLQPVTENYFVKIADDKILKAIGIGTIQIQEEINNKVQERELQNVLLVPELKRNLVSIGTISAKNFSFHVYKDKCEIRDSQGKLSSVGVRYKDLFRLLFKVKVPSLCNVAQIKTNLHAEKLRLWHERMGHVNIRAVQSTCKEFALCDATIQNDKFFCEACVKGK